MPGYIDEAVINQIRNAVDISALIGDYVTLKRKGQNEQWGLCPFHNEKTPSFHVIPGRGLYKCFGCGRGGNAFAFLMELEGVSFVEAVRSLAERTNIDIPLPAGDAPNKQIKADRDLAYSALQSAANYFHGNLIKASVSAGSTNNPPASKALDYLLDRGIKLDIIIKYNLGWAEPGWNMLVNFARGKGINGQVLMSAGLASKRKTDPGYIDRFRARIIFPILNLSGKPVAFGARRLEGVTPDDDKAKYVNSPETLVYKKSEHLYGLFSARDSIRKLKHAFLVEGYTDLLAMEAAGLPNVIASLGTSLTESQARLALRFTPNVRIVYDSDSAGTSAAVRAADILVRAGLEARMVSLPAGNDPDSLLREKGAEALKQALTKNVSFVAFRLEAEGYNHSLSQPEQIAIIRSLMTTVNAMNDHIGKRMLLSEIARITGLPETELERLKRVLPVQKNDNIELVALKIPQDSVAERDFIRVLIGYPELAEEFLPSFSSQLINHGILKRILEVIENDFLYNVKPDAVVIIDKFSDPVVRSFISDAAMITTAMDVDKARETAHGCIKAIAQRNLQKRTKELQLKINEATRRNEPTKGLLTELVELRKQKAGSAKLD